MKILVMSDLHFEFHADGGREFARSLSTDCDVLVLAGDIDVGRRIPDTLRLFTERFTRILYVVGNHELYGSSPREVDRILGTLPANIELLEEKAVTILGQRFLGCSLWFAPPRRGLKGQLSDFRVIREFEPWVYDRNKSNVAWLEKNVQKGDVVVTHHLPAPASVHKRYRGSSMNEFFLCDVSNLIVDKEPAIWIHGHTHDSFDYKLGSTRVVCNPFGYVGVGDGQNHAFEANKIIELPSKTETDQP
jgi:Icc-related predicted phosphoesterase